MATVFHSLSDVELLRAARTSPLMNAPLFACASCMAGK